VYYILFTQVVDPRYARKKITKKRNMLITTFQIKNELS